MKHAVGVGNGSDALYLILDALSIGPGDEVITAPNSYIASAAAIARTGATPVFCDVADDMNLDPAQLEAAITKRTKAVMPGAFNRPDLQNGANSGNRRSAPDSCG